ncbi:MAG: hypothetical protein M1831_000066 [Alyxoria varia]|nr:MAG: hypothetical protein M1831_000066 [Alyxoria varia]
MSTNGVNSGSEDVDELSSTLRALGLDSVPSISGLHLHINPVDIYRAHLVEMLAPLTGAQSEHILPAISWTQTLDHGDLTLPVPALRLKGKKPDELAKDIVDRFPESPLVQKPAVAGTHVVFFFKPGPLMSIVLSTIRKKRSHYGFNHRLGLRDPNDLSKGAKRIIVEFSSPNIAKPFHAGHLRSTIIGGFLSSLYECAGWDVVRMNYLGDWGKQYGVLAVGYERFGNEEALSTNPIGHLYDVYVKTSSLLKEEEDSIKAKKQEIKELEAANQDTTSTEQEVRKLVADGVDEQARRYFKRMVDGDDTALNVWRKFRNLSIEKYKQTYARLNIKFDDYAGESQVTEDSMNDVSKVMEEKGVIQDSDGAKIVDLTKHSKKLGKAIVKKKDGTSLYLTRDIGEIFARYDKYGFDKMIYVVASQQDLHLAQLFKIVDAMGRKDVSEKCVHINFGMVLGMSTRKGTAKFLDDILRDVGEKMHEVMRANEDKYRQVQNPEMTADILGISAVMIQDMTGKRINNYEFDMDRMTSFEGDTGPYLQYAHARLCSITRKAGLSEDDLVDADWSLLTEKHAIDLVRSLARWPDVFQNTLKTQEPVNVVGSEEKLKKARLSLYTCARQVLYNGMKLLGLSPVERM